jgi:hypothetical protein
MLRGGKKESRGSLRGSLIAMGFPGMALPQAAATWARQARDFLYK